MTEMTRLARLRPGNVGSLGLLPIEICNKVYAFLLADFDPCPPAVSFAKVALDDVLEQPLRSTHSIETAILRTSKDGHREAYDLMVKMNHFVHVRSVGTPMRLLLATTSTPIVTGDAKRAGRFNGYVLDVRITSSSQGQLLPPPGGCDPFEAMMLARDLDKLCEGLEDGGCEMFNTEFSKVLVMILIVGPVVLSSHQRTEYKDFDLLAQHFSEKTQQELLQPFGETLREVHSVQVSGRVSDNIARSTSEKIASIKYSSPQEVLDRQAARKEAGTQYFKKHDFVLSGKAWTKAIADIDTLRKGNQWSRLVHEGGQQFIDQLADLYFRLHLNLAHQCMSIFITLPTEASAIANIFLTATTRSLETGYWKEGFTWRPSDELRAKLHFRMARVFRLQGDRNFAQRAMHEIDEALLLRPGDPAILKERHDLQAWISQAPA
ncbi:hypothetical protein J7T55_013610 [Diaporthe amygdali]|uniref:uncharacterized protein n=1 Tax=Phomopsis amygdali TaxID=1214568 RepID=UPI0022FEC0F5|nr:uncharacterized protein J7T55_013610 [Diaporthe amygdali]KAJ0119371.1 hypothetical protein J7T55_013610 [Diaporthe amygdali]